MTQSLKAHSRKPPARWNAAAIDSADPLNDALGRPVFNVEGIGLGEVVDLFREHHTGKVRFLRVASGGILGVGKAFALIPAEAVLDVDDERVLADLDPNRLVGTPSYLALGQPRWDIPLETRVVSADAHEIGKVTEVHPGFLVVEKGVYFPHDLYVPNDAIATYDGHLVHLALPKRELLRQGWDEAPPIMVRAGRPAHWLRWPALSRLYRQLLAPRRRIPRRTVRDSNGAGSEDDAL